MSSKLTSPHTSAWVSASAGTGKTKLLIDRLARLLVTGSPPNTLLCLTYTRAAAGEMLERLQRILHDWQKASDEELSHKLNNLLELPPSREDMQRARQLAALCKDEPVPIQTLHSFASTILRRAGDTRRLIEGHELHELWQQTCYHVFQKGEHQKAWNVLAKNKTWHQSRDLLWQFYQNRFKWLRVHGHYGTLEAEHKALFQLLPPSPDDRPAFDQEWDTWQDHPFFASFGDKKPWMDWGNQAHIQNLFLTQKGEPRKRVPPHPLMQPWQESLAATARYMRHYTWFITNQALKEAVYPLLHAMSQAKQSHHVLDYSDLLEQAMWLLENDPRTMERLHNQLHHILVDEAQDTSPEQWAIIRFLVRTFLNEEHRTLFVVGDLKQSIYSFQGANPDLFFALEHDFAQHFHNQTWTQATLEASWRSTAPVLQLVDTVFHLHTQGVHTYHQASPHKLTRHHASGRVELWPLVPPAEYLPELPWQTPPVQQPISWPLAEQIADRIQQLLSKGEVLPSTGQPVQPHDIWVLLSRRGPLMSQIEQALLARNIPTSGMDRLSLWDHLVVQDMMALARFVLLPHDDWSLACLLKSPLVTCPLTEEELFALCHKRKEPLWPLLQGMHPEQAAELTLWITAWKNGMPPSMWFAEILQSRRSAYLAALGHTVDDIIHAFLTEVQSFEQQYAPSLEAFIAQDRNDLIKRYMRPHQGVHLTTVHSSKGLQAPIIILGDATDAPRPQQDDFVWSYNPPLMALRPTREHTALSDLYQQHHHAVISENRRLLYVALTRAADQLYVTGLKRESKTPTWYNLIQDAITQLGQTHVLECGSFDLGEPWQTPAPNTVENIAPPTQALKPIYQPHHHTESTQEAKRGIILHKWLEVVTPTSNPHTFLQKYDPDGLVDAGQLSLCQSWLNHSEWAWIFKGQSEVDIVDANGKRHRIDRLVVHENDIWIFDFKSGWLTQNQAETYRPQMHTYKKVIQDIYPKHVVHACLVHIAGPSPQIHYV